MDAISDKQMKQIEEEMNRFHFFYQTEVFYFEIRIVGLHKKSVFSKLKIMP